MIAARAAGVPWKDAAAIGTLMKHAWSDGTRIPQHRPGCWRHLAGSVFDDGFDGPGHLVYDFTFPQMDIPYPAPEVGNGPRPRNHRGRYRRPHPPQK